MTKREKVNCMKKKGVEIIKDIGCIFVGACCFIGVFMTTSDLCKEHLSITGGGVSTLIGIGSMVLVGWFIHYIGEEAVEEYKRKSGH